MNTAYYNQPESFYNVLYFDDNPELCAQWHSDQHLRKGLLWAAQVLSMVWFTQSVPKKEQIDEVLTLEWSNDKPAPYGQTRWSNAQLCGQRIYFTGHNAHPCVNWASEMGGNYDWLYRLGSSLAAEFRYRYRKIHACEPVTEVLELMPPTLLKSEAQWCDAPVVLPSEFKSYKQWYRSLKGLQYTKRERPSWL